MVVVGWSVGGGGEWWCMHECQCGGVLVCVSADYAGDVMGSVMGSVRSGMLMYVCMYACMYVCMYAPFCVHCLTMDCDGETECCGPH